MDKTADHDFEHKICFRPIGFVSNEFDETASRQEMREGTSRIALDKQWAEGLEGLEPGQPLLVIFHFDRIRESLVLRQHPRGDQARPRRGVFALRSPLRPNAIGVTRVILQKIEGNLLHVRGLDAYNGTPILDLKPAKD
jgi:tRNA (adenine37-N6)-methyltransferase